MGNKKNGRKSMIIIAVVVVAIVALFALWEFVIRDLLSEKGIEEEYEIDFWLGDDRIRSVTMSELMTLPNVSYQDVLGSGATDEGPLLKDVVLLVVNESSLNVSTTIVISSDLTGEERTLPWGDIANTSNSYILDFTNKGTTKFSSPETQKKDRVRDVTDIRIGG